MGIKAVVSSSLCEDIQKAGGLQSEFLTGWLGWKGWGDVISENPRGKITLTLERTQKPQQSEWLEGKSTQATVWVGSAVIPEHTAALPAYLVLPGCSGHACLRALGSTVVTSASKHWVVQHFGLYSTGRFGPPSISFLWLHCRKVNLYIKLSHSSLSKNIMCLAQDPPGVCIRGYYELQGSNVNIRTECPEVLFLQVVNSL